MEHQSLGNDVQGQVSISLKHFYRQRTIGICYLDQISCLGFSLFDYRD